MHSDVKSLRDAHVNETREAILGAAEAAFVDRGFAPASIDHVGAAAGLTKGAVYHHFPNKRALFREVYRRLAGRVLTRLLGAVADTPDPATRLQLAVEAFLACGRDPSVREVLFVQGPAVLSGECREIDQEFFLGALVAELDALAASGVVLEGDHQLLASLVLGLLIEAAQLLGRAEDFEATSAELARLLPGMLRRMIGLDR